MTTVEPLMALLLDDPYPTYAELHESGPVTTGMLPGMAFASLDAANTILRTPVFSVAQRDAIRDTMRPPEIELPDRAAPSMLFLDPPDHTRLRRLVSKAFTTRMVERLRPRIEQIVDGLLAPHGPGDEIDLMELLAYPLPVVVIAELLGLPVEDHGQFKEWSDRLVVLLEPIATPDQMRDGIAAAEALREYLTGVLAERRREPREDLVSALAQAEEQGDALSEDELYSTCILLLAAGHETTTNLLGNGTLCLLRHPDEHQRLLGDPSLVPSAVEEMLRFESPIKLTARVATERVEVDGTVVEPGTMAITLLGAADRDPRHFPDPDRFDVGRQPNRHVAFGSGIHLCLGAPLARLEGEIAFGALLRRFPGLSGSTEVRWKSSVVFRALQSLPVTL